MTPRSPPASTGSTARSILAFSLFIGSNFILAGHPGRSRSQVLQLATDRLLAEAWG